MMTDADFIREVQSCERRFTASAERFSVATRIAATLFRKP